MGENVFKFWTKEILKELVITVGNEPVLINNFFHYGIIWIKKMGDAPRGMILKNRINHMITPSQAIGRETPDLETFFSNSSKSGNKNDEFLKNWHLVIWYASRLASSFKPVKPFPWVEQNPKTAVPGNHLWLMSWDMLTKITHFSEILLGHDPLFGRKWPKNLGPKG